MRRWSHEQAGKVFLVTNVKDLSPEDLSILRRVQTHRVTLVASKNPITAGSHLDDEQLAILNVFQATKPTSPTNTPTCSGAFKHDAQLNHSLELESVELGNPDWVRYQQAIIFCFPLIS